MHSFNLSTNIWLEIREHYWELVSDDIRVYIGLNIGSKGGGSVIENKMHHAIREYPYDT